MQKLVFLITLIVLCHARGNAQQSRVDSAIALMAKSNTPKGLDTPMLKEALGLISTAELTDAQVNQIEKAAESFRKADDESLFYLVKFQVLTGLTITDRDRAIDYGKQTFEKLETGKLVHASYLQSAFLSAIRLPYRSSNARLQEGILYYNELLNKYKRDNDSLGISGCYWVLGGFYRTIGLFEPAIYNMKKSISYFDTAYILPSRYFDLPLNVGKSGWVNNTGVLCDYYNQTGDYARASEYGWQALEQTYRYNQMAGLSKAEYRMLFTARHLAMAKVLSNQLDSAEYYLNIAEQGVTRPPNYRGQAFLLQIRALYHIKIQDYNQADSLLRQCWQLVDQYKISVSPGEGIIEPDYYLALLRIAENKPTAAIPLLLQDIERLKSIRTSVLRDYKLLATLFAQTGQAQKANEYYTSFINLQDSILADQAKFRTISFETEQLMNQKEMSIAQLESENKISTLARNFTIGIAALLLALAGSIYYRFRSKKKANAVLEKTLAELKSTQSQLIQSEKMASLGELTAGIAHEIQNPLNFVNNFAEVNTELLADLEQAADSGDLTEVKLITQDLKANEDKIRHHGKRADSIVKGMLQHSQKGTGQKQLTDLNALADEYFRLAYHGLRAKDNSFNADMQTVLDENIGSVMLVQQDISRVLLNLYNNAFYAVAERHKKEGPSFKPLVTLTTARSGNNIHLTVTDNGSGIPEPIKHKIFQPFFTTKPTGQGTGLGLSLSYDIVKAHGGEISVSSVEGEGSVFTVVIPIG